MSSIHTDFVSSTGRCHADLAEEAAILMSDIMSDRRLDRYGIETFGCDDDELLRPLKTIINCGVRPLTEPYEQVKCAGFYQIFQDATRADSSIHKLSKAEINTSELQGAIDRVLQVQRDILGVISPSIKTAVEKDMQGDMRTCLHKLSDELLYAIPHQVIRGSDPSDLEIIKDAFSRVTDYYARIGLCAELNEDLEFLNGFLSANIELALETPQRPTPPSSGNGGLRLVVNR